VSLLFSRGSVTAADLIPRRSERSTRNRVIAADEAMRSSAVWACLRLRADLISTSPVDCYRTVDRRAFELPTPPVLVNPGGSKVDITEWLYSTQVDLDRFGNCFGLITSRDGLGFPSRIDLLAGETMTVKTTDGVITEFRSGAKSYDPSQIWHEKQYTVAGLPIGLSPIAAAAMSLRTYLSAQEFAAEWFGGGAVPSSHLKNTAKTLNPDEATKVKDRFNASVRTGDVFVTGNDWEYEMLGAKASESSFLESMRFGVPDICRYLGVPADMIDGGETGGSITYANVTQRNLQLLIMNLGPAVTRREKALTLLLPKPRFVKLNTDAVVLRMDPKSRADMNAILLSSKQRSPSEVREKDDLPPFTPDQIAEIQALAGQAQPGLVTKENA
jgi:HK97 family phage portal protein